MRVRWLFLAFLLLNMAGVAGAQQTQNVSPTEAMQAAEAFASHWTSTYNAGNAGGLGELFSSDGTFLTPVGTVATGAQEIQDFFATRMKAGWTTEAITVREAHPAGDAVWADGDVTVIGSGSSSGKRISGHWAEVLVRSGTDWKLRMLIANNAPPAQAQNSSLQH